MEEVIRRLVGIKPDPAAQEGEEPILLTQYESFKPAKNYIQLYEDAYLQLMKVDACALRLVLFMLTRMDSDNMIDFVRQHKLEFIRQYEKQTGDTYTAATIDNALVSLKKAGLLRGVGRGYFMMNPVYFFRDASKTKRIELIRFQVAHENNQLIEATIGKKEFKEIEVEQKA